MSFIVTLLKKFWNCGSSSYNFVIDQNKYLLCALIFRLSITNEELFCFLVQYSKNLAKLKVLDFYERNGIFHS